MQRILFKRSMRNLKKTGFSYLALFILIVFCMIMVVVNNTSADTVINRTRENAKALNVEDGEFQVLLPLTESQLDEITKMGVTIEKASNADFKTNEKATIRVYKNRKTINKQQIITGTLAKESNEIALEKRYAEVNKINIGDEVSLGGEKYIVTGTCVAPDYECVLQDNASSFTDPESFGVGFMTDEGYENLKAKKVSKATESFVYTYLLGDSATHDDIADKVKSFKITIDDVNAIGSHDIDNLFLIGRGKLALLIENKDNLRIYAAANDQIVNSQTGVFAGVLILLLIAYVISVFVSHEIQEDSKIIGTLYALGVRRRDLILHYLYVPVFITMLAGGIGLLVGFSEGVFGHLTKTCYDYFSIPHLEPYRPVYLILYSLLLPPVLTIIVNVIVIMRKLNRPALSLIRNESKARKSKSKLKLEKLGFTQKFQLRQFIRERRASIVVVIGMLIGLLVLMLPLNCKAMVDALTDGAREDVKFEYVYTYKYPTKEVPEGGYEAYGETFTKERFGYTFNVTLLGLKDDNPFFDVEMAKKKDEVVISSAMAEKFGLKAGDVLKFERDGDDKAYEFKIKSITQFASSFYMFMDIDIMRNIFEVGDTHYNIVFSDKVLDIPTENLYSTSTKADVIKAADIVSEIMQPMIYVLSFAAIVIFVMVMFLMLKMMVDKSKHNISLLGVLGYRPNEVRKLYLDGNFFVIAIGALISIPISKWLMDLAYPIMCSNVACGMDTHLPIWTYFVVYFAIIALYLIINACLVFKIRKINPSDVIKNRE